MADMDIRTGKTSNVSSTSARPIFLAQNAALQPPLSRLGKGPGLLLVVPEEYKAGNQKKTLDPEPCQKWAEEGFVVVEMKVGADEASSTSIWGAQDVCKKSVEALNNLSGCVVGGKIGVIVYDLNLNSTTQKIKELWKAIWKTPGVTAVVSFIGEAEGELKNEAPLMIHTSKKVVKDTARPIDVVYTYESASSPSFILPSHKHYNAAAAGVAHTRSLAFLKKHLGGPNFDLEAIWDEHTKFEFGERDVEKTMATMVEEPYVNHVPTMTGGVGRAALTAFYRDHFIFNNPEDTQLELISRTVGVDRVIDEFIFSFTHNKEMDWLIPGIPPTNRSVQVPFTSIVNIRGDRLYHEHIAWDQASVLRQLGLLPEYLPFPYPLPDGRTPAPGKRFEYRVPTAGVETAMKLVDESSVKSNDLLEFELREVDDV